MLKEGAYVPQDSVRCVDEKFSERAEGIKGKQEAADTSFYAVRRFRRTPEAAWQVIERRGRMKSRFLPRIVLAA